MNNYKVAYGYDENGYYTGKVKAWEDPLNKGNYLLPRNATFVEPPSCSDDEIPQWLGNEWKVVTNYLGKIAYDKNTKEEVVIDTNYLPENLTLKPPPHSKAIFDEETNDWIIQFDVIKQEVLTKLKRELQNFIYSHYDQGIQASFMALYQQAKEQNNTDVLAQIQKIWDWINSVLNYYYSKKEAIKSATTKDELDNVIWNWQEVEEDSHVELQDVINMLNQQ